MKKSIILLLSFTLTIYGYTQIDINDILNQKKSIPENWVSIIAKNSTWDVINSTFIGDKSRKVYPQNPAWNSSSKISISYQFAEANVLKSPFFVDTIKALPIKYFSNEGTFYASYKISVDGKPVILKFPFQVYYLDSTHMVLEQLDEFHFDYETGKILSDEELEKVMLENRNKSKNQPGNYVVTDSKKNMNRKSEEGLRIVELLELKNN